MLHLDSALASLRYFGSSSGGFLLSILFIKNYVSTQLQLQLRVP